MPTTTVFLDCEFTDLAKPELLSLGLAGLESGDAYVEFDAQCTEAAKRFKRASEFVHDTVLPQFGLVADCQVQTAAEFGQRIAKALESFGPGPLTVAYDYDADFALLQSVMRQAGCWAQWADRLVPTHVGYVLDTDAAQRAMDDAWSHSFATQGLERHHALADARALRAAFLAHHG